MNKNIISVSEYQSKKPCFGLRTSVLHVGKGFAVKVRSNMRPRGPVQASMRNKLELRPISMLA